MTAFDKILNTWEVNWRTVLVGWEGLGFLSPWPDRWIEFAPLISIEEIQRYCDGRLSCTSDFLEQGLIVTILSTEMHAESRESIREMLVPLAALRKGDPNIDLRKWRLVLLEQVLANMPLDTIYGPIALGEFWQGFGWPSGCPQVDQSLNLRSLVDEHRVWIDNEKAFLQKWKVR